MSEENPVAEVSTVSLRVRAVLYVASWAAALLALDYRLWALVYLFPAGLFAFMPPGMDGKWARPLLCLGWAIYILHAVFFFRARQRRAVWIWFGVLLLLLAGNVGGCHQMLRGTGYGH